MAGIKKTYVITENELNLLESIKDKGLDKKIVLNDSFIVRLGINLASKLSTNELIKAFEKSNKNAK